MYEGGVRRSQVGAMSLCWLHVGQLERERERGWSVGDDTQRSEEGRSLGFLWRRVGLDLRRIFVDFI